MRKDTPSDAVSALRNRLYFGLVKEVKFSATVMSLENKYSDLRKMRPKWDNQRPPEKEELPETGDVPRSQEQVAILGKKNERPCIPKNVSASRTGGAL